MTIAEWWSDISEKERIEHVRGIVGVWSFGGVQMCFALLPNEAKAHLYDVFKKVSALIDRRRTTNHDRAPLAYAAFDRIGVQEMPQHLSESLAEAYARSMQTSLGVLRTYLAEVNVLRHYEYARLTAQKGFQLAPWLREEE